MHNKVSGDMHAWETSKQPTWKHQMEINGLQKVFIDWHISYIIHTCTYKNIKDGRRRKNNSQSVFSLHGTPIIYISKFTRNYSNS